MTLRSVRSWVVLGIGFACIPSAVQAQGFPQTRAGFFIGYGVGWGSYSCSLCQERQSGLAGYLKLGVTLGPALLVGVESGGMTKDERGARLTTTNITGFLTLYPSAARGGFLKGGVGMTFLSATTTSRGSDKESGFGATLGAGYDIRLKENFSVTLFGNWLYGSPQDASTNVIQLGVGMTWH